MLLIYLHGIKNSRKKRSGIWSEETSRPRLEIPQLPVKSFLVHRVVSVFLSQKGTPPVPASRNEPKKR